MPRDPRRVKELFLAAAGLSPEDRPGFLTGACDADADLRAAVDRLLAAHDQPVTLLNALPHAPAFAVSSLANPRLQPELPTAFHAGSSVETGTCVGGRYKLVEMIGEGGMGEVWVAQQTEPVRRLVAVKLIKPGMDSKQVLARFEAEQQALALMEHPNIARVLDAGMTADRRPYFVMELVKGTPIIEFCDARKLTTRERLGLFVSVCRAIQHAHHKGVIHRDLKPSNILIALYDDRAVPKVIDFGVAKAIGQPLTEKTLLTGFGTLVGTPEYMSPEQATFNALDVDTRTDVYALGVLLYELLTGTTPFSQQDLEKIGLIEVLRVIRETEPLRPSTKLSTAATIADVAAKRGTEPRKLASLVRGELDWIALKALEKDRTRRYETAASMAEDVERYLAGDPVRAVPPSARYRLLKFVRRNKGAVLAAALVFLTLTCGVTGTTLGLIRADEAVRAEVEQRRIAVEQQQAALSAAEQASAAEQKAAHELLVATEEKKRADKEATSALDLAYFLQDDILRQAGSNPNLTVREALDRAAERVAGRSGWSKGRVARVRWAIGDAYVGLGECEKAINQLKIAQQLMESDVPAHGPDHSETIFGLHKLALAYRAAGQITSAIRTSKEAVKRSLGRNDPIDHQGPVVAMNDLAQWYLAAGQTKLAVAQYEDALRWVENRRGAPVEYADRLRSGLIDAYFCDHRTDQAIPHVRRLVNNFQKTLGEVNADTAKWQAILGSCLLMQGEWVEAEAALEASLKTRQTLEPESWKTFSTQSMLGDALRGQQRFIEAEPLLLAAYRGMKDREETIPREGRVRLVEGVDRLVKLYVDWEKPTSAARWRAERTNYPLEQAPAPRRIK